MLMPSPQSTSAESAGAYARSPHPVRTWRGSASEMPSWWDYLPFGHYRNRRNLEDGLFQIASQTCNILVKVNNTNNINVARSDEYGCAGPPRGSSDGDLQGASRGRSDLRISVPKFRRQSSITSCAPKLSTVLEDSVGNASSSDEELEQWEQIFMMRDENGNAYSDKKKRRSIWCRPSCIPVCIVLALVVLVVLVPLLDQLGEHAQLRARAGQAPLCHDNCRVSLVESIPEGGMYPAGAVTFPETRQTWLDLIDEARSSIEIASFYWTLRLNEVYPHNSSIAGEQVFKALYYAGTKRNIQLRIAQNAPSKSNPNTDTELLLKKKAAQVRSLNFSKLLGGGVLHTKFWLVDRAHFYIGSANMDWRSLTQVKELGIVAYNCSCLAADLAKIFDVYWALGAPDAVVPPAWPKELATDINLRSPLNVTMDDQLYAAYISSSPPPLSPSGRTDDADGIVAGILAAEHFVYIAVMEYAPLIVYAPTAKYWGRIDEALRRAAVERGVRVRLLVSHWQHSQPADDYFLRSLHALSHALPRLDVQVRRFVVPATADQAKIPFARVNHNKYMVTDRSAHVGTSNWYGDYFTDTAGVSLVLADGRHEHEPELFRNESDSAGGGAELRLRAELQALFERDWRSPYALPLLLHPAAPAPAAPAAAPSGARVP